MANTLVILAQVFEQDNQLPNLEKFTSLHGPKFYKLAVNTGTITLSRTDNAQPLPADVVTDEGVIKVFDPKMPVFWKVDSIDY